MLDAPLTESQASLIARAPRGPLRALLSRLFGMYCTLSGLDRYDGHRLERVADLQVLVMPTVANPVLLRTGACLAAQLDAALVLPHMRVLDMGTGSGICALAAARHAQRVTGIDINPAAVRCAGINALLNRLEQRVEFRHGDLFAPVSGERFDLVLFNPPFLVGEPRDDRDAAWRSRDVARRFSAGLRAHLAEGGFALLLLSSFGDASVLFEAEMRQQGFALSLHSRRRFLNEVVTILRAEPRP